MLSVLFQCQRPSAVTLESCSIKIKMRSHVVVYWWTDRDRPDHQLQLPGLQRLQIFPADQPSQLVVEAVPVQGADQVQVEPSRP